MARQGDPWRSVFRTRPRRKPTPAATALDVHRRVLQRRIEEKGWTREEICNETGWKESRLLRLLNRLAPLAYEDLFTVLEAVGVTRKEYFKEICRELAGREGA